MDKEETIQCPYNFSHLILKSRMAAHLIKCRLQYPTDKFSICPFNSTHDVPTPELQYHVENCKDRGKLDSFIYVTDEPKEKCETIADIELPSPSENWDEEPVVQSYLNVKNEVIENQPVFRIPVGMSKAERKAFFHQEVERFGNITSNRKKNSSNEAELFFENENLPKRKGVLESEISSFLEPKPFKHS